MCQLVITFWCFLQAAEQSVDDLMDLVKQIVPFHVKVNLKISSSGRLLELPRLDSSLIF